MYLLIDDFHKIDRNTTGCFDFTSGILFSIISFPTFVTVSLLLFVRLSEEAELKI